MLTLAGVNIGEQHCASSSRHQACCPLEAHIDDPNLHSENKQLDSAIGHDRLLTAATGRRMTAEEPLQQPQEEQQAADGDQVRAEGLMLGLPWVAMACGWAGWAPGHSGPKQQPPGLSSALSVARGLSTRGPVQAPACACHLAGAAPALPRPAPPGRQRCLVSGGALTLPVQPERSAEAWRRSASPRSAPPRAGRSSRWLSELGGAGRGGAEREGRQK